eukprot:1121505-Prorocentrum_minimum.AAC.1
MPLAMLLQPPATVLSLPEATFAQPPPTFEWFPDATLLQPSRALGCSVSNAFSSGSAFVLPVTRSVTLKSDNTARTCTERLGDRLPDTLWHTICATELVI